MFMKQQRMEVICVIHAPIKMLSSNCMSTISLHV